MDIRQEIEYNAILMAIEIQIERVETLHKILLEKYFRTSAKSIKPYSANPDDRVAVHDLCASYPEYTALIDISYDSLIDIRSKLCDVIRELYTAR